MTQGAAGEHSSAGVSTVFPLLARLRCIHAPPTTFPAAPPARFVLTSPPCPAPPLSGEALATKLALVAPGTGSSATLFESERRRRLSTNLCNAGAGCVGPPHRTPSGSRLPTSRGSLGERSVCLRLCLCLCLCPCRVVCVVCNSRTGHCSILALATGSQRLALPLAPRGPPRPHARHTTEPGRRAFLLLYKTRTPTPAPVSGPSAIEKKDFGEPTPSRRR